MLKSAIFSVLADYKIMPLKKKNVGGIQIESESLGEKDFIDFFQRMSFSIDTAIPLFLFKGHIFFLLYFSSSCL